jgi:hypothetical protein
MDARRDEGDDELHCRGVADARTLRPSGSAAAGPCGEAYGVRHRFRRAFLEPSTVSAETGICALAGLQVVQGLIRLATLVIKQVRPQEAYAPLSDGVLGSAAPRLGDLCRESVGARRNQWVVRVIPAP